MGILFKPLSSCTSGGEMGFSFLREAFQHFSPISCLRNGHHGGILIEFAFSIPLLITVFFFACDHYRYCELKNKIKTSTYLAASMVQQLGNTRPSKQLTKADITHIAFASCLNFFHTNAMFSPHPFGVYYAVSYEWVQRVSEDNYKFQHCFSTTSIGTSPAGMNHNCDNVKTITKEEVKAKNANLVCPKDGDERVCIECCYRKPNDSTVRKNVLGFFMFNPVTKTGIDGMTNNFFFYQIVIKPKPRLFPAVTG